MDGASIAGDSVTGEAARVIRQGKNDFVSMDANCFIVYPDAPRDSVVIGDLYMVGDLGEVKFDTWAVINRNPGGNCTN